ncbi:MAG: hypothetical protein KAG64_00750 [Bacteroidales bacterium]|nr:hypothetical protein [Bacteroidales bacterium]
MKNVLGIFVLIFFFSFSLQAQQKKEKKWSLDGYISYMNSNMFDSISNAWSIDNQLHNRLNFEWFPNDKFSFVTQLRTRFIYGNSILVIPGYADMIEQETGYLNMNKNVLSEKNFLLNMNVDRLYFKYSTGNWDMQIGRQRINWARTMVWNPNDIFNTYSYFDFDYMEKPGSDAFRLQYYTGAAASLEIAASINHEARATVAAKWLINKWNYDFQFIAGEMEQRDYIAGFGWAGAIKSLAFRGEATYFHPINSKDTMREESFSGTFSLDYTFGNSLNLMGQVLYTTISKDNPISNFATFYTTNLNAKYLSFTEWNLFASAMYPITPLLNITFAGMYYPKINGFFLNPSFDYSLSDNLTFSFVYQYFKGEFPNPLTGLNQKQQFSFAFLRIKQDF